jgi:hypothetical protein
LIEEIRSGLKRWAGPHPEFDPLEGNLDESDVAGVLAFSAERGDEVAYWLEAPRAAVFGDAILGDQAGGLRLTPWARNAEGLERTRQALLPLLELPIEVVLTAHGDPVLANGRDALARALNP